MKRAFSVFGVLLNGEIASAGRKMNLLSDFKDWNFRNPPAYIALPIDNNPEYNVPVAVKDAVFSKVPTEPLQGNLHLVAASDSALRDLLDLDPVVAESAEFIDFVAGKYLPEGGFSVCHRYGGYQFGYWADQLGDGRAHILGEYVNRKGDSIQLQLKGSGETPYSRFGDGRAVLRSSIRELIGAEASYYLGIPTTRGVALVVSDDHKVWRDKTYSGRAKQERAAVLLRSAPSWFRLGSVEILNKRHEPEVMKILVNFIVKNYFPHIDPSSSNNYVQFFTEVAHKNLDLVASWQGFGFVHGVLNTDNVSMHGLSIDYGPYGFMDRYNDRHIPNTSDDRGRYAYSQQPEIMLWNLEKFFEALLPILPQSQKEQIKKFLPTLKTYVEDKVLRTFLMKLGLKEVKEGDDKFVEALLSIMFDAAADFTATFRQLSEVNAKDLFNNSVLEQHWSLNKVVQTSDWEKWRCQYVERIDSEGVPDDIRQQRMKSVNPVYVPRNWIMQDAIADAEDNQFQKVRFLLKLFSKPFEVNKEAEERGYSAPPPNWAHGLKLSCSS